MLGAHFGRPIETPWVWPHAGHHETDANFVHEAVSMMSSSKRHLADVRETYFEHLGAALGFSVKLVKAGTACAIHAIVPALCTGTASRSIAELNSKLATRAALPAPALRNPLPRNQAHARSDDHRLPIDA